MNKCSQLGANIKPMVVSDELITKNLKKKFLKISDSQYSKHSEQFIINFSLFYIML